MTPPTSLPPSQVESGRDGVPSNTTRARLGQDRPKLVVVKDLELTTLLDPYLPLRALAAYSGCSIRWLRDRLYDLRHPLPYYRLPGGKILVRRSEFDAWLARYRHMDNPDVKRIVTDTIQRLRKPSKVPA